jgi:nucleoside-diphosphate-sugar epimerase
MKKVLILGVNGFIGHHLSKRILETTDWDVYGMDMQNDRLGDLVNHPRMHFFEGDITINKEWVVGYGLDNNGIQRELPHIYKLN